MLLFNQFFFFFFLPRKVGVELLIPNSMLFRQLISTQFSPNTEILNLTKTFLRVKIRESIGLVRGNMGAAQTIAIYVKTTSLE
jgi:hypothetical protein